jgi:hypothetical protein
MPTIVRLNYDQRKEFALLVKRIGWAWPDAAAKFHLPFGALIAVRRGERDFDLDNFAYLRRVARAVEAVPPPGSPDVTVEGTLADLFLEAANMPSAVQQVMENVIEAVTARLDNEKTVAEAIKAKIAARMAPPAEPAEPPQGIQVILPAHMKPKPKPYVGAKRGRKPKQAAHA